MHTSRHTVHGKLCKRWTATITTDNDSPLPLIAPAKFAWLSVRMVSGIALRRLKLLVLTRVLKCSLSISKILSRCTWITCGKCRMNLNSSAIRYLLKLAVSPLIFVQFYTALFSSHWIFRHNWRNGYSSVAGAITIAVWGYSFKSRRVSWVWFSRNKNLYWTIETGRWPRYNFPFQKKESSTGNAKERLKLNELVVGSLQIFKLTTFQLKRHEKEINFYTKIRVSYSHREKCSAVMDRKLISDKK